MDNSKKDKIKTPGKKAISGKGWIIDLLFPILQTIIGSSLLVFFIAKFIEPKTGELLIQSNIDSAKVFLNGEFKGITGPIDTTLHNIYVLRINSVYPGSYQLMLQKKSLNDVFINDVVVNPGYLTSKSGLFISLKKLSDKEKQVKTELKDIDKELKLPETKNERPGTSETTVISSIKKPIARRLAIWLTEEIQLAKVSLYVNSSFMGTPSSYEFSIELPEGMNEITFTYSDALGIKYIYSITRNISGNDTLIIQKNEFTPMQGN